MKRIEHHYTIKEYSYTTEAEAREHSYELISKGFYIMDQYENQQANNFNYTIIYRKNGR